MSKEPMPVPDAPSAGSSPLLEAELESLDELFARDPLQLSEQDLDKIIANLRAARNRWLAAEAGGARSAPKAKAKPKAKPLEPGQVIELGDLGL
jgi:hypothetical protein